MRSLRGLLANDASLLGHHGSALVTSQAQRLAKDAGLDLQAGYDWDSVERSLQTGTEFDLVVVNGEGSIHDDSKTARRIARLAQNLAERDIPAFLINASEEANSDDVYAGLRTFRSIYVRDSVSRASLAAAGITSITVPDLTLSWSEAPRANGDGPYLVTDASDDVQARRLFDYAQRTGLQSITLRTAPTWPIKGSIRRRLSFESKRLISGVLPASPWSLRYSGADRNLQDFVSQLQRTRGIISGRFHAICLAIRMSLPFLAISAPTGKIDALLSEVGLVHRRLGPDALENAQQPIEVEPFSQAELEQIHSFLGKVEADARQMFAEIVTSVRGHC